MIGLTHGLKIYICTQPTDMRRGFDGLSGMALQLMQQDPLSGCLLLFRNRQRDRLKILYWDRDGLAIWYKRLEQGTFQFPTDLISPDGQPASVEMSASDLALMLGGVEFRSVRKRRRYELPAQPR